MTALQSIDLTPAQFKEVKSLLAHYLPNTKVWAYGSRVRWSARPDSDLDMVAFATPDQLSQVSLLREAFEESNLPFPVDLFVWDTVPEKFRVNIQQQYVEIQSSEKEKRVMGSEWIDSQLSDFINIKHGFAFKGEFFKDNETADCLMTPGNFAVGGGFKGDKFKYYSGPVPEDYVLNKDDLVVTMTDLSKEADTLGYSALVPEINGKRLLHNQRVGLVQFKNDELDKTYLYFLLRSREYRHHVVSGATGTTVKHSSPTKIVSFEFKKPPKDIQVDIGQFLLRIEHKITLNRQLNQTLEQMAQALFKSWFVDFDPVIDNALAAGNVIPDDLQDRAERRQLQLAKADHKPLPENVRKLFPSEFELTESLGWVPKGWLCKTFADVTVELRRGISPKYIESDGILVLNQKCIRDHDVNFSLGRRHDSFSKSIDGRSLKLGDVLVNSTGVGTLGRVAQIKYLPEDAVVDSHVTVVRSNPEIYPAYTFAQQIIAMESEIEAMGEGSTGQTELSRKVLSEKYILLPSLEVLKTSEEYFINFAMKSAANIQSTEELAKLRDTLLPKLISGELRIPEAQAQLEAALV